MRDERRRARSDIATVLLHWTMVVAVTISLISGFPIADDAGVTEWTRLFSAIFLHGDVFQIHLWSSVVVTVVSFAYAAYLFFAKLVGRIVLDKVRLTALASSDRTARWGAINVAIYWLAFGMLALMAATGLMLYDGTAIVSHETLAMLHRGGAWAFLAYAALHAVAQLFSGGIRQLLKILSPRLAYGSAAAIAVGVGGAAAAATVYAVDALTARSLTVARIGSADAPRLDGRDDEGIWQRTMPVTLQTTRGSNFPGGEVPVTIRAAHDGQFAYFMFTWPDSTRSQKHLPIVKTADGWRVLEKNYSRQDEDDYYEDKFGVMLAKSGQVSGGSTHLGRQPIAGAPGSPNERGLHYTTDGSMVDVWHWKSVRTGGMGMIDDNYFGAPIPPTEEQLAGKKRYTGGYTQDPHTKGGFIQNWKKLEGGLVQPLHLPAHKDTLKRMEPIKLDPTASDEGTWWLPLAETQPYTPEADATLPVGTVLPSAVIDAPFEGDRGDVLAVGYWQDGEWRLEVRRKLITNSKFDQPIATGTYLWVAAFDHSQTRHTRHLRPLRLELEQ
ncbi:ethylbenzene dehydrogenase-related protein [Mesorhizobium sp.]|uniref:ethylbenzene dehydrogenase-related protein n=1 Tax=Mesorhizobium sp. TaxID=1871066 RepID=UPI000FE57482|nr:ethylbenzene dehydrogenase-related protein [Mesorhizobium sp.]RWO20079.1 MAG: hypothetical protein EOS09_28710 [Mesorhizobium sp.]